MKILALDLSKRSTGWALYQSGWNTARYGHWKLGSEFTTMGQTFCKLHSNLAELHSVAEFDVIAYEQKINPANLKGLTNLETITVLAGLETHTLSFAHAYHLRCRSVHIATWRADFIGRQEVAVARKAVRDRAKLTGKKKSARDSLKALTMERCRQFGWEPRNDDEGDALGILDYSLALDGHQPPWRAAEVLKPVMGVGA